MEEQIDVESALLDAILELSKVEDIYDRQLAWSTVSDVIEDCLRPALASVQANEKRIQAAREMLGVVLAINEQATDEARQDPGVLPVLQQIHRKIAQLTAPELLASIKPEVRDAE